MSEVGMGVTSKAKTQVLDTIGDIIEIDASWEIIEPRRGFDYQTNGGCWLVAKTPSIKGEKVLMYIRVDSGGFYTLRDPKLLTEWSIKGSVGGGE